MVQAATMNHVIKNKQPKPNKFWKYSIYKYKLMADFLVSHQKLTEAPITLRI